MSNLRQFIGAQQGTYVKGARYPASITGNSATVAGSANKNGILFLAPFLVRKTHSFTGYAFKVRTTGGNIRIGLFPDDATNGAVGSTVIAGSDTTSVAVGSSSAEQTISATLALSPGVYWCGYQLSSALAVLDGWTLDITTAAAQVGMDIAGQATQTFPQITQAFGAFPAPIGNLDAAPWVLAVWPIHLIA